MDSPALKDTSTSSQTLTIALVGPPNVGKSSLFNLLTGLNQRVGNWPGKTVEIKSGVFSLPYGSITLVDLPGIRSLTALSEEERLARDFLLREQVDGILLVVNASSLESNLYLLAELLPLHIPIFLVLNMMDVAQKEGIQVNPPQLEQSIGIPVIPVVAVQGRGVDRLTRVLEESLRQGLPPPVDPPEVPALYQDFVNRMEEVLRRNRKNSYPPRWIAIKLLEGDPLILRTVQEWLPEDWPQIQYQLERYQDAVLDIAGAWYEWVREILNRSGVRRVSPTESLTDRVDRWATHPFWGLVLLFFIASGLFGAVYSIGVPLQDLCDRYLVQSLSEGLRSALASFPPWLVSLLADGIVGGVGIVLTFLPLLLVFYTLLGFLEDIGYAPRIAFVIDQLMQSLGLRGSSFLPLFLAFGCNVPAVIGSRIIDSVPSRLFTILLIPLVPCAARIAVVTTLTAIFFRGYAFYVTLGILGFNLLLLVLLGRLLSQWVLKGDQTAFVIELPLYHKPSGRTIAFYVWQQMKSFLQTAGTIILMISVLVWVLASLPSGDLKGSYLAQLGHLLAPLASLMGFDWRMLVALLTSFIAKENSLATMGILFEASTHPGGLAEALFQALPRSSALAYLVVQTLFIPCVATVATIRKETGSWIWTLLDILILLVISFLAGIGVYHLGIRLGLG